MEETIMNGEIADPSLARFTSKSEKEHKQVKEPNAILLFVHYLNNDFFSR